jgi:hypothetical protein
MSEDRDNGNEPRKPRKRPIRYSARAKKPAAGITNPNERRPTGAMSWRKPTLLELAEQNQLELFPGVPLR